MDSAIPVQTPGSAAAMMGPITTVHLILIGIFAVLTIAMIVFGMRLKAKRRAAEAEAEAHREAVEAQLDQPAPTAPPITERGETGIPIQTAPATAPAECVADSDLTRLKGLGPKLAAQLAERGLTRIEQIAALSAPEAAELDTQLGSFNGRLSRDRWVEQARLLVAGDTAGYEAQFGRL